MEIRNNVIGHPGDVDKNKCCPISSRTAGCKTLRPVLLSYSNLNHGTKYTSHYVHYLTINFLYIFMNNSVRGRVGLILFTYLTVDMEPARPPQHIFINNIHIRRENFCNVLCMVHRDTIR